MIELKANQRSLRYGLEDSIKATTPTDIYKEGPYLEHGRIESRVCRIFRGEELIADREKWNGNLTVIEILTSTEKSLMAEVRLNSDCIFQAWIAVQSGLVR